MRTLLKPIKHEETQFLMCGIEKEAGKDKTFPQMDKYGCRGMSQEGN